VKHDEHFVFSYFLSYGLEYVSVKTFLGNPMANLTLLIWYGVCS